MALSLLSTPQFKWLPCSHSWVALHPRPKGVIQFVGSTLLGTFPTVTYRHFLQSLFVAGYTVVALPFRFTFNHWSIALDLLEEHYTVRGALIEAAVARGYDSAIYLDAAHYTWLGHGLGCKYIVLLELLSAPMEALKAYFQALGLLQSRQWQQLQSGLASLTHNLRWLEQRIQQLTNQTVDYGRPSIIDEAAVLLAPMVTDLNGAVPIKALERFVGELITVSPTIEQTHQLIGQSQLFQLAGVLQFARDRAAVHTCHRLMQEQPNIRRRLLKGNHLEPVGIQIGEFIVDFNPLDKFIQPLQHRDLELQTLALIQRLRHVPPAGHRKSRCDSSSRGVSIAA